MAEVNGHDVHEREQIRERPDGDIPKREFKRQRSEETIRADRLGGFPLDGNGTLEERHANGNHESDEVTSSEDKIDGARQRLQGIAEDSLNWITRGKFSQQIGSDGDNVTEEQYDNNIEIRHPKCQMAKGIKLGVHFREHENGGFIVRKVLEDGLLANKAIRPGDIITHVGETDVRKMTLADLQKHFWNSHLETNFTLKILRRQSKYSEDEDEAGGAPVTYVELIVKVPVTVEDGVVKVTTEIEVKCALTSYKFGELQDEKFLISVDGKYLHVQNDMTLKAVILLVKDQCDKNFQWRQQLCTYLDCPAYRLLYNVGTRMTICCESNGGQIPNVVMSSEGPFEKGSQPSETDKDRLFIGNFVSEGIDNYYLKSVSNQDYYMCLSSDPGYNDCVKMATESKNPKTEFRFEYLF